MSQYLNWINLNVKLKVSDYHESVFQFELI